MFKVEKHIWVTGDGKNYVPSGHADAAFLAYPAGTEVPDSEAKAKGLAGVYPDTKAKAKPADKAVEKPSDKAAPKGGVTITRLSDQK